jgi:hypothetical protein
MGWTGTVRRPVCRAWIGATVAGVRPSGPVPVAEGAGMSGLI